MISLRIRTLFESEWTHTSFDGPDEEQAAASLIAAFDGSIQRLADDDEYYDLEEFPHGDEE